MRVVFLLSQVVIAITMVVSTILGTKLSSGVLPRPAATSPGSATCTTTLAMLPGTTATVSRSVLLSVALGIDYLSI